VKRKIFAMPVIQTAIILKRNPTLLEIMEQINPKSEIRNPQSKILFYLRARAVLMEAITIESISSASALRLAIRFSFIRPASTSNSIQ